MSYDPYKDPMLRESWGTDSYTPSQPTCSNCVALRSRIAELEGDLQSARAMNKKLSTELAALDATADRYREALRLAVKQRLDDTSAGKYTDAIVDLVMEQLLRQVPVRAEARAAIEEGT